MPTFTRDATCRNCASDFRFDSKGGATRPLCQNCEATYKWCPSCGYALVRAGFGRELRMRDGLEGQCRRCKIERKKLTNAYHQTPDPRVARARKILTRYGLTQEQWDAMIIAHGGRCAICEAPSPDIHIDHCHSSNRVRGLLCPPCNKRLGHFGDDVDRMFAALAYLMGEG